MTSLLLLSMNPSASPFFPSSSFAASRDSASHPSSPSASPPPPPSMASAMASLHHRLPVHRLSSNVMYHTAPASSFPSLPSTSVSLAPSPSPSPLPKPPLYGPGELLTEPLAFKAELRSLSGHGGGGRGSRQGGTVDSLASTLSSLSSTASSLPSGSPQSSPPYSPHEDLSPLLPSGSSSSSRYGTTHHQHLSLVHDSHHADRSRRLSDSQASSPFVHSISYSGNANVSGVSTQVHLSVPVSASSAAPSSSSSSSLSHPGSVDPRAHDPDRLHALLRVVFHMESSGAHAKFLSQLGILYKQMFPHLFVKGMLKDLVDYAVTSGLLKLTGPAGQQQVHLTTKARLTGAQQIQQPQLPLAIHSIPPAQSPSPVSSPSSSSPSSRTFAEEDDARAPGPHHTRTRSGSIVGSSGTSTSRHSRAQSQVLQPGVVQSLQYSNTARVTPTTSPQLSSTSSTLSSAMMSLPPLTIAPSLMSASLPPVPIPAVVFPAGSLEEKYFRFEKPRHLYYMFHFRVHACKAAMSKSCTAGDSLMKKGGGSSSSSSDCFDYHSASKTRRRIPRIVTYTNGTFWSYNACRCQAIEKEIKCEKGDACRYSHNKEEIAYHPSRYKTQLCSYPARPDGVCTRFGLHCAYAHGEDDIRKAIVLRQGMPHKLLTDDPNNAPMLALTGAAHLTPSLSAGDQHGRGAFAEDAFMPYSAPQDAAMAGGAHALDADDFMTPKESLMSDRSFYLFTYKVHPCSDPTPACAQGSCPHFHYDNKRRRSPRLFQYSHEPCPAVKPDGSGQWKRPSSCPMGDSCPLAHTLLEAMYHPDVYKTVLCSNFDERDPSTWRRCQWGRMCAHAHSKLELDFNEHCHRHGEQSAMAAFGLSAQPQMQQHSPASVQSHGAVIVYDTDEVSSASLPTPPPLGLFYRDGKPKDTKPPLPPLRPMTGMASISYSPAPMQHGGGTSVLSPLTSPSSMSNVWGKPSSSPGAAFSSPASSSAPSSNSSSPAPSSARQPAPIQPRSAAPVAHDLSYFTPMGPTLLRDEQRGGERPGDDEDSIIIPSHFSTASTGSPASTSNFLSPLAQSLHSWQSTPSGPLTPSSAVQPLFGDLDGHFDASFMDSGSRVEHPSSGGSPTTRQTAELQRIRQQLKEEVNKAEELRKENGHLRQQLASANEDKAASEKDVEALCAEVRALKAQLTELQQQRVAQEEADNLRGCSTSPTQPGEGEGSLASADHPQAA